MRRERPVAVMQRRLAVDDRAVKLVDHFAARNGGHRNRIEPRHGVVIDHDAVRLRAQVGALAGHDHESEMLVLPRPGRRDGRGA